MITPRHLPGAGLIKGMMVTGWNFLSSYFDKDRLVTVSYPEERMVLPENSRNFPFLIYDGTDAEEGLRCTSCKICEKECPPQVIRIVQARDANGKLRKHPEVFDIDIHACLSCQICVEVCPFESIKMDSAFEYAETERFVSLVFTKKELSKPNSYYQQIKPTEAHAVDAGLEADRVRKEEAAAKRDAAAGAKAASAKMAGAPGNTSPQSEEEGRNAAS